MKKAILFLLPCMISFALSAQDSTSISETSTPDDYKIHSIFGAKNEARGGYGAVMVDYTEFNNHEALLIGGKGAFIVNHRLALGFAGYGLTSSEKFSNVYDDQNVDLELGYGGFLIEPIIASSWPIHVSFPILLGAGGAAWVTPYNFEDEFDYWDEREVLDADAFYVLQPGVNVELNLTKHFRMGLGMNYRFTHGLNLENIDHDLLEGFSTELTLAVGKF